jgi:hypothetical protein
MKEIIRKTLAKIGYKIEKITNPNPLDGKYRALLKEIYGVYRDLKFNQLEELDLANVDLMYRLDGTQISESLYILNALKETRLIAGDVCEFGVAQGFTSALLGYNIKSTNKGLWLFDSFKGLPQPSSKDKLINDIFNLKSMDAYEGTMSHNQNLVLNNLQRVDFPSERIHVIPGFIEESITKFDFPKQVSFAYVDFDFYNPIKVALEYLHNVLSHDGKIIVDDYGFFSEGAKTAVDEFLMTHPNEYRSELPIPSAGKFIVLHKK